MYLAHFSCSIISLVEVIIFRKRKNAYLDTINLKIIIIIKMGTTVSLSKQTTYLEEIFLKIPHFV